VIACVSECRLSLLLLAPSLPPSLPPSFPPSAAVSFAVAMLTSCRRATAPSRKVREDPSLPPSLPPSLSVCLSGDSHSLPSLPPSLPTSVSVPFAVAMLNSCRRATATYRDVRNPPSLPPFLPPSLPPSLPRQRCHSRWRCSIPADGPRPHRGKYGAHG